MIMINDVTIIHIPKTTTIIRIILNPLHSLENKFGDTLVRDGMYWSSEVNIIIIIFLKYDHQHTKNTIININAKSPWPPSLIQSPSGGSFHPHRSSRTTCRGKTFKPEVKNGQSPWGKTITNMMIKIHHKHYIPWLGANLVEMRKRTESVRPVRGRFDWVCKVDFWW